MTVFLDVCFCLFVCQKIFAAESALAELGALFAHSENVTQLIMSVH